jgi:signal transduction histidine kinase
MSTFLRRRGFKKMQTDNPLSARIANHPPAGYTVALSGLVVALLVCQVLSPFLGNDVPYIVLFPAVAFAAWYAGLGPSVLTVALALAGAKYWFIPPLHSLRIPGTGYVLGSLAFLFASGVVVAMGEERRRDNEKLRRAQGELEEKVRERTAELDSANQSLRDLSARLLESQDDERRRIARELHDSVGQTMVALTMNLSTAREDIERLTKTVDALTDSEAMVQAISEEVRTISHLLHPPLLDEAGLSSALRWYIDGFAERSKIKVDLEFPSDLGRFSRELETAIFRTVQECLTNIHRHSESPIARVRLIRSDGQVRVEVQDRGKGIAPEKRIAMHSAGVLGVGIRGMRERLRQLGGSLEISSDGNGKGTLIVARLPVIGAASTAAALQSA